MGVSKEMKAGSSCPTNANMASLGTGGGSSGNGRQCVTYNQGDTL